MGDGLRPISYLPTASLAEDEATFFADVLTGWKRAHLTQNFAQTTFKRRLATVQRFVDFTGRHPWHWTMVDADDFFSHLRAVENLAISTVRSYQTDVKLFLEYSMNPSYPWNEACGQRFGFSFSQVVTDLNRAKHVSAIDAQPAKRPFSPDELQALFDLADLEVERCLRRKTKGALAAWRDAVAFKTLYAWGLRADEMRHLQLVDFSRNRSTPYFGDYGVLNVRWGKAMKGSPKKQRTVHTVFDWAAEAMAGWIELGLPRYGLPISDVFPTDGGQLIQLSSLRRRLSQYIAELEFPDGLDLHSLRRSYASDLQYRHGYDRAFVSLQLGHEHESTTSIYSFPAPDYASQQLKSVLDQTLRNAVGENRLRKPRPRTGKDRS